MKKFSVLDFGALAVWLLPAVYLVIIYGQLPQNVPMHYDIHGNVNSYGSKAEFCVFTAILMGVSAFVFLLLKFLPFIDPKKQVKYGEGTFQKIAFGLVVFLTSLNIVITYGTMHNGFQIDRLLFPLIGLFFVFMGNMMNSLKPNYFAGIKTPWTLESEDNWRATHRLAAKVWVIGGLILTVTMLFLPPGPATIVFMCCVGVMAFIPITFSYLYFRKHRLNQNI